MTKLPKWVEVGAFALAFIAGSINVIGMLGFEHQSVSHMSGTATLLGNEIQQGHFTSSVHLVGILVCFVLGAMISGYFVNARILKLGRHYDTVLYIETLALVIAWFLFEQQNPAGLYLAAAACGMQNALVTAYSGAIIRTTHLTGIFTDIGIMLGAKLKGKPIDSRRMVLFLVIVVGFIVGAGIGSTLFNHIHYLSLLFPALICLSLAATYSLYKRRKRK